MSALHFASSILAQVNPIDPVTPSKSFPGAPLIAKLLSYGMYLALALSVGAVLYGGGAWAWSSWGGNGGSAMSGRRWLTGGVAGALISGVAVGLINGLFTAAGTGVV